MSSLTQVQPAATVPRWRRITFYVIAALVLLMILGLLWPLLMFIVFTWMPIDTVRDILAVVFPAEDLGAVVEAHRIHLLSLALVFWGLTIGVGLQLWKPERRQAPMLQALAVVAAFVVIDSVSGSFDPEAIPVMVGVALLALLHPTREGLVRVGRPHVGMSGLAVLAAIPGVFFVLDHIGLQRADIPSDPHAEFAHWSAMAVFATLVVLWGLIGATELTGRRITAWLTGVSAVTFGVASLVFPNLPSAAGVGWAVAAVAWGAGYLVLTEREAHRRSARQGVGVPR